MTKPDASEQDIQRRWRELAAQLGLDPEPLPEPPPPPSPTKARTVEKAEEPAAERMPESLKEPEPAPEALAPRKEWRRPPRNEELPPVDEPARAEETVAEPSGEADETPRSGRRRRRRGRRSGRDKADAAPAGETPADVEAVQEEIAATEESVVEPLESVEAEKLGDEGPPERSRRRGRGRSRRAKGGREQAPQPAVAAEREAEDEPDEPEERTVEEEDEGEDMSTWTVPSWQELIASLYRPDRDRDR